MTDRVKLIELLKCDLPYHSNEVAYWSDEHIGALADHLISHGVVVREKGEWKYYRKQGIAVCTSCSFERKVDDNFGKAVACPNCGADMRTGENG